jgi:putative transposase
MADSKTLLEPEGIYHIYNHAVGSELLFFNSSNYQHFLNLFKNYLIDYVNVYAYCLMPNHFHFVIQVKSSIDILKINLTRILNHNESDKIIPNLISTQFSHVFNSYAQAINKQENRKGSLFNNRFKRKPVTDEIYLQQLIHYIHFNPIALGLCNNITDWQYSSYNAIVSRKPSLISSEKVVELYDDLDNFIFYHKIEPFLLEID